MLRAWATAVEFSTDFCQFLREWGGVRAIPKSCPRPALRQPGYDPAPRHRDKGFGGIGAFGNLNRHGSMGTLGVQQFVPRTATIGADVA
jgi:hypothetical protein